MSLGMVGHHVSVFHIDGTDENKTPHIVNSCLAYIHAQFSSKDKISIREQVCHIFSLEQIKSARKILFTTHEPDKQYKYNGPHSKSERDKAHDAFEGIYGKISKLDAENKVPIFSVPSSELLALIATTVEEPSHVNCDTKFKKMENDMQELHATFNNFVSIVTSSRNHLGSRQPVPKGKKSIPPATRDRLLSNVSKRSASEMSNDEITIPSDVSDDDDFVFPKKVLRKRAKINSNSKTPGNSNNRKQSGDVNPENTNKPSWSQVAQRKPPPPATKGTLKTTTAFRGAVPEIFLFNCDVNVTAAHVAEHFNAYDIKVRKIEKKSHVLAARSSFKVSPETKEDYDKILSEEFLPEDMCARKYLFRRGRINTDRKEHFQKSNGLPNPVDYSHASKLLQELDKLDPNRADVGDMDTQEEQKQTENGSK